jgi:hypothetical protein
MRIVADDDYHLVTGTGEAQSPATLENSEDTILNSNLSMTSIEFLEFDPANEFAPMMAHRHGHHRATPSAFIMKIALHRSTVCRCSFFLTLHR